MDQPQDSTITTDVKEILAEARDLCLQAHGLLYKQPCWACCNEVQKPSAPIETPCKRFDTGWLCRSTCTDPSHGEFLQDQN